VPAFRAFHAEVKDVIFKPVMGGAITWVPDDEALDRLEDELKRGHPISRAIARRVVEGRAVRSR
jgi:hypothetical protein